MVPKKRFHEGKLKNNILIVLSELDRKFENNDFQTSFIRQNLEGSMNKPVSESNFCNAMKRLIDEKCIERVSMGKYQLTPRGQEVCGNILPNYSKINLPSHINEGAVIFQIKVDHAKNDFYEILNSKYMNKEEIKLDFQNSFTANVQTKKDILQTQIEQLTDEGEFQILMFFQTPRQSKGENYTLFDFHDNLLRNKFLFYIFGHVYFYILLPTYKKIRADGNENFFLRDIKLKKIFFVIDPLGSKKVYYNSDIGIQKDNDTDPIPFIDIIDNNWSFKLDTPYTESQKKLYEFDMEEKI